MKHKEDYGYGIIPVIKVDGQWQVFLIDQYGLTGDSYWTFPKGHAENNETKAETALRELTEETEISISELDSKTISTEYEFIDQETLVQKRVEFFIGYADDTKYSLQEEEVKEGKWCSFDQARALATYQTVKEVIDQTQEYLESKLD